MKIIAVSKIVILNCMVGVMLCSSLASANDEADKLKQLERAMTSPSEKKLVTKPRTRAIVFDSAPQNDSGQAPATPVGNSQVTPVGNSQAAAVGNPQAPATPMGNSQAAATDNCSTPAADAKITAVDFAIQFKGGSAKLTTPSEKTLQQIAKILALSNNCVLVEGHTDTAGDSAKNLILSRQRADSVVKFIAEKAGIAQSRLVPVGKGSSEPLINLDSRNPKNRRVVFKVVS